MKKPTKKTQYTATNNSLIRESSIYQGMLKRNRKAKTEHEKCIRHLTAIAKSQNETIHHQRGVIEENGETIHRLEEELRKTMYLRKKGDPVGRIHLWTPELAKREDMESVPAVLATASIIEGRLDAMGLRNQTNFVKAREEKVEQVQKALNDLSGIISNLEGL